MKRRFMPIIIMLTAGAVSCVVSFIRQDALLNRLVMLLIVLVVFYGLGDLLRWMLEHFEMQNAKADFLEEGEVIEKEFEVPTSESVS